MNEQLIKLFRSRVQEELNGNIMPFWLNHAMDQENSGFIGRMSNNLVIDSGSPKGLILNARLLWTFSAMARFTQNKKCLQMARYAYQTLINDFWDPQYGGAFWAIGRDGKPINSQKKTYGQAFLIFGLAEYHLLTQDAEALSLAKQLFELLETCAWDEEHLGYFEVMDRDWTLSRRQQLSDGDLEAPKSMNTHLHLLEAYTHFYSTWRSGWLAKQLKHLLSIFEQHILDPATGHFRLFFDTEWNSLTNQISFGHDIEGSWLLHRAAEILQDPGWLETIGPLSVRIAEAVYEKGLDQRYGLMYESDGNGLLNAETHFWCQAEAVVGFLNAFQLSGRDLFFETAWKIWQFIEAHQIDKQHGEWFWKLDKNGRPDDTMPKISEWKCPYHNGRACIETIQRLTTLLRQPTEKEETSRL